MVSKGACLVSNGKSFHHSSITTFFFWVWTQGPVSEHKTASASLASFSSASVGENLRWQQFKLGLKRKRTTSASNPAGDYIHSMRLRFGDSGGCVLMMTAARQGLTAKSICRASVPHLDLSSQQNPDNWGKPTLHSSPLTQTQRQEADGHHTSWVRVLEFMWERDWERESFCQIFSCPSVTFL